MHESAFTSMNCPGTIEHHADVDVHVGTATLPAASMWLCFADLSHVESKRSYHRCLQFCGPLPKRMSTLRGDVQGVISRADVRSGFSSSASDTASSGTGSAHAPTPDTRHGAPQGPQALRVPAAEAHSSGPPSPIDALTPVQILPEEDTDESDADVEALATAVSMREVMRRHDSLTPRALGRPGAVLDPAGHEADVVPPQGSAAVPSRHLGSAHDASSGDDGRCVPLACGLWFSGCHVCCCEGCRVSWAGPQILAAARSWPGFSTRATEQPLTERHGRM